MGANQPSFVLRQVIKDPTLHTFKGKSGLEVNPEKSPRTIGQSPSKENSSNLLLL